MNHKSQRDRHYALLQVGKNQLGWDDDFYRDVFLVKHGAKEVKGRVSASTMSIGELMQAVEAMKQAGFKPARQGVTTRISDWRKPRIKKITALWCALADAGVVHDRSESAMQKWCAGISKKAKLEWANAKDLNACIEALKKWAAREHVRLQS